MTGHDLGVFVVRLCLGHQSETGTPLGLVLYNYILEREARSPKMCDRNAGQQPVGDGVR